MAALTMERMARNILADPPWMKVFKNSYDSVEENLNKVKTQLLVHSCVRCCSR